jgi:hypothetical protein
MKAADGGALKNSCTWIDDDARNIHAVILIANYVHRLRRSKGRPYDD